jgi:hypothetical protein
LQLIDARRQARAHRARRLAGLEAQVFGDLERIAPRALGVLANQRLI